MLFLASVSDVVQVVTGSAVSTIGVEAAWVDNTTSAYTPGRTLTAITTAATTTVVAAPAASTVRNLKNLNVSNNHASSSCVVSVQHSDGTTVVVLEKVTLLAGETLVFVPDGGWSRLTAAGAPYARNNQIPLPNLGISGALAETLPRMLVAEDVITPVSGTVYLFAVYLVKGTVVSSISAFSSGTAANSSLRLTRRIPAFEAQRDQIGRASCRERVCYPV